MRRALCAGLVLLACTPALVAAPDAALLRACRSGHLKRVELLLGRGADIEARGPRGLTSLSEAAYFGHLSVAKFLVEKGADTEAKSSKGLTPLLEAALQGHVALTRYLVEKGADIDVKSKVGATALHEAAFRGSHGVAALLLEHGAIVDAKTSTFWTPLLQAARQGNLRVAQLLVEHSADIDARSRHRSLTPLLAAATYGHLRVAIFLLGKGAATEARTRQGCTPLLQAVRRGHFRTALSLIQFGASIDTRTHQGLTLLHEAARHGHVEKATFLLENKANLEARTSGGFTPLLEAAAYGHLPMVKYLLERRADVDARNKYWMETPLLEATKSGHMWVTRLLVANGADIEANSSRGFTALHEAARRGDSKIVSFLVEQGADIEAKTEMGFTPQLEAASHGHTKVMEYLVAKGAKAHVGVLTSPTEEGGRFPVDQYLGQHSSPLSLLNLWLVRSITPLAALLALGPEQLLTLLAAILSAILLAWALDVASARTHGLSIKYESLQQSAEREGERTPSRGAWMLAASASYSEVVGYLARLYRLGEVVAAVVCPAVLMWAVRPWASFPVIVALGGALAWYRAGWQPLWERPANLVGCPGVGALLRLRCPVDTGVYAHCALAPLRSFFCLAIAALAAAAPELRGWLAAGQLREQALNSGQAVTVEGNFPGGGGGASDHYPEQAFELCELFAIWVTIATLVWGLLTYVLLFLHWYEFSSQEPPQVDPWQRGVAQLAEEIDRWALAVRGGNLECTYHIQPVRAPLPCPEAPSGEAAFLEPSVAFMSPRGVYWMLGLAAADVLLGFNSGITALLHEDLACAYILCTAALSCAVLELGRRLGQLRAEAIATTSTGVPSDGLLAALDRERILGCVLLVVSAFALPPLVATATPWQLLSGALALLSSAGGLATGIFQQLDLWPAVGPPLPPTSVREPCQPQPLPGAAHPDPVVAGGVSWPISALSTMVGMPRKSQQGALELGGHGSTVAPHTPRQRARPVRQTLTPRHMRRTNLQTAVDAPVAVPNLH